jgi:hypothetical protein
MRANSGLRTRSGRADAYSGDHRNVVVGREIGGFLTGIV